MDPDVYPPGTVRALLHSDLVTPATRAVIVPRLERGAAIPRYFESQTFTLMQAVCARLIPQSESTPPLDLAGNIDERLAEGKGDGWRYDAMPPDGEAYRQGLEGVDESALILHSAGFVTLTGLQQDELISAVQRGDAPGKVWASLSGQRFIEELLAEATECYYSDPLSMEEIGYVGMADSQGWLHIGLNQREPFEPQVQS